MDELVTTSRRAFIPLRRGFIQQKRSGGTGAAPLASFVRGGDRTGLLLYLLVLTKASAEPWDVRLPSAVWARALGLPNPNSEVTRSRISKTWARLSRRGLIRRERSRRLARIILLREDGSGAPYDRPQSHYVKVPHELWSTGPTDTDRWYEILTLPELVFLLIARSHKPSFSLPAERGPAYYGISADTLQRGARGLRGRGLLSIERQPKTAPLAPEGYTIENVYTLRQPFGFDSGGTPATTGGGR